MAFVTDSNQDSNPIMGDIVALMGHITRVISPNGAAKRCCYSKPFSPMSHYKRFLHNSSQHKNSVNWNFISKILKIYIKNVVF